MGGQIRSVLWLSLAYTGTAWLGLQLDPVGGFATLVWPPTGLALGVLARFGRGLWPGVWLGALAANLIVGAPLVAACGIATGNSLEAVLGATLLRRGDGMRGRLERLGDVVILVAGSAIGAAAVSATVGVGSLWLTGAILGGELPEAFSAWWIGDVLGALIVAPVVLTFGRGSLAASARPSEGIALGLTLLTALLLVFGEVPAAMPALRQPYLLAPVLTWAAARFGPRGAAWATLAVSVGAIAFTAAGLGPFVQPRLREGLLALQVFIGFTAMSCLVAAALAAESVRRRRDLEAAFRVTEVARAQAEAASQLKDTFLSLVSHELRTPLASLLLLGERLRLSTKHEPAVAERMMNQAERLAHVVDELLEYTRVRSGRLSVDSAPVDVCDLAFDTVEAMRPKAEAKALAIELRVNEPEIVVDTDARLLSLILTNLLGNAVKYTELGHIELDVRRSDAKVLIAVSDTGPGIEAADQTRVFEPFTQLEGVRGKHRQGVGLGLTLARELVHSLGGSIVLDSSVGVGSVFTVHLPVGGPRHGQARDAAQT